MLKTHSCKHYVQETRDHHEQRYDAHAYLEDLERLNIGVHLGKQMLDNARILYCKYAKSFKSTKIWRTYEDYDLMIDMSLREFRTFSPKDEYVRISSPLES